MFFWHTVGNQMLTLLCNVLFDTTLTDMETCYKVFTIDIARQLRLREHGWGFDPEITARILKMGNRIYEVPISYAGREFNEGKKITWRDGFVVLLTLLKALFLPLPAAGGQGSAAIHERSRSDNGHLDCPSRRGPG